VVTRNLLHALARSARADARLAAEMYASTRDPEWRDLHKSAVRQARDYALVVQS